MKVTKNNKDMGDIITDNWLIEQGFELENWKEEERTGYFDWDVEYWCFRLKYKYYLGNTQNLYILRQEGKYPQFNGYYWIGTETFSGQRSVICSKTKNKESVSKLIDFIKSLNK